MKRNPNHKREDSDHPHKRNNHPPHISPLPQQLPLHLLSLLLLSFLSLSSSLSLKLDTASVKHHEKEGGHRVCTYSYTKFMSVPPTCLPDHPIRSYWPIFPASPAGLPHPSHKAPPETLRGHVAGDKVFGDMRHVTLPVLSG